MRELREMTIYKEVNRVLVLDAWGNIGKCSHIITVKIIIYMYVMRVGN